jgi:glycosyltransferase involved in cell wall biosynthesis
MPLDTEMSWHESCIYLLTSHHDVVRRVKGHDRTAARSTCCTMIRKILYVGHTAQLGGAELALLNLVSALDRSRYSPVVVIASDGPLIAKLRQADIEAHVLPLSRSVVDQRKDALGAGSLLKLKQAWECVKYARKLALFARKHNIDLIHTNSLKADIVGGVAGRLAGIPVLWHIRDNIDSKYLPARVASTFKWLATWLPTALVANSYSTLSRLEGFEKRPHRVVYSGVKAVPHVVHDGIDVDSYRDHCGNGGETRGFLEPIITLVGRIAEWKGQHIFIEAAAEVLQAFPRAKFRIVGTPLFGEHEYEKSLHVIVERLGLSSQVEFLGFRSDIPELIAQSTMIVHASILGEPFGQVVIEGMSAGKPVIATDGGALPEIIEHGVSGLLVPMGDASAMALAIKILLSDRRLAINMGMNAQQRVIDKFTIQQTINSLEEIYKTVLQEPVAA